MSIHKRDGKYQVRYRMGERNRARTFPTYADAETFQIDVKRRQRLGELTLLDAGRETLADFVEEWWRLHGRQNLSANTRALYAGTWDRHVLNRLGDYRLRELTPQVIQEFRVALARRGVGEPTILKALTVLQSVLRLAVVQGRIQSNPVTPVKKPAQGPTHQVRPLPPELVERIRARLRPRDAMLVSLLAYAGVRPGEALALLWLHVRERTLLVERSIALEGRPKSRRGHRTVNLLAPLSQDLAEWRLLSGRPVPTAPLFVTRAGMPWSDPIWRNWRRRIYQPAAEAVDAPRRPYDLRHSFVSLLIHAGVSLPEVARQAGHSVQTCMATYMHTFAEFDPSERVSADVAIRRAREKLREAV